MTAAIMSCSKVFKRPGANVDDVAPDANSLTETNVARLSAMTLEDMEGVTTSTMSEHVNSVMKHVSTHAKLKT